MRSLGPILLVVLMLAGCVPPPLTLPAGWPLPQLRPPGYALPLALGQLAPPDRPYYSSSSDDSIRPALAAHQRLLGGLRTGRGWPALAGASSYADQPVVSSDGTPGRGWGIAYRLPSGWNASLAACEDVLKQPDYEIVEYVPGQLRVYHSHDRQTEVVLVTGRRDQLLLAVNRYGGPLPSERQLAAREDAERAARALGEQVKAEALEMAQRLEAGG